MYESAFAKEKRETEELVQRAEEIRKFKDICAVKVLCSFIEVHPTAEALTKEEKEWGVKEAWDIAELMAEERMRRIKGDQQLSGEEKCQDVK